MSKIMVPEAPQLQIPVRATGKTDSVQSGTSKPLSPLDAAFLARIYRSMAWFGFVLVVLVALGLNSIPATASFAGGVILAAFLLRAQEVTVRAIMRPKQQLGGMDARLFLVFLLPLKLILMVAMLAMLNYFGMIRPAMLAVGFFAGQLVIVAKVVGWMMTRTTKK